MTDSDDIVKEFLAESAENLDRLDRNLVVLEKQPEDREILADIFRVIHTIKGTSGFLAFPKLETVTHAGESLLARLRDGHLSLTPEITTVLLAMVDAVRHMLEAIGSSGTDDGSDYQELIQQLTSLHDSGAVQEGADKSASPAGQTKASVGDPEKFPVMAGRLGAVLIEQGSVTAKQLARALEVQEKGNARPLGEILVESGALSPQELQEALKAPAEPRAPAAEEATIRIRVGQLDRLMNLVGELVLARNRLQQWVAGQSDCRLLNTAQRLNLIITELQEGVMKSRLQPIENVWNKFPRTVRDVARGCGKQVRIELEGKETELDKTIIEAILPGKACKLRTRSSGEWTLPALLSTSKARWIKSWQRSTLCLGRPQAPQNCDLAQIKKRHERELKTLSAALPQNCQPRAHPSVRL